MDERILTLHPNPGKQGVRISRTKYDVIRKEILACISAEKTVTFGHLMQRVGAVLEGRFDGSVSWYVTTVKLDLEARGLIERVPGRTPQELRPGKTRLKEA